MRTAFSSMEFPWKSKTMISVNFESREITLGSCPRTGRALCKSQIVLHNKAKMDEKAEFIGNK